MSEPMVEPNLDHYLETGAGSRIPTYPELVADIADAAGDFDVLVASFKDYLEYAPGDEAMRRYKVFESKIRSDLDIRIEDVFQGYAMSRMVFIKAIDIAVRRGDLPHCVLWTDIVGKELHMYGQQRKNLDFACFVGCSNELAQLMIPKDEQAEQRYFNSIPHDRYDPAVDLMLMDVPMLGQPVPTNGSGAR